MDEERLPQVILRKEIEETLRAEFEYTLSERVSRYLDVKPHEISPNQHFASVSEECAKLYRDGHFYGCIALTQAVAEAIVRFLCDRNGRRSAKRFEENVKRLSVRNVVVSELVESLLKIWEDRDDYHHLNPSIETDRRKLAALANEKARLLVKVEREVFHFEVKEGKLIPRYPKYWDINGDQAQVFLRLEP